MKRTKFVKSKKVKLSNGQVITIFFSKVKDDGFPMSDAERKGWNSLSNKNIQNKKPG
jgi:hypothetical protein